MIPARWLFENHLHHIALKKYLELQIECLQHAMGIEEAEMIQELSLARPPFHNASPSGSRHGSTTEWVALEMLGTGLHDGNNMLDLFHSALQECRYLIELHGAVVASLSQREKWLMNMIYIQKYSISRIIDHPNSPYGPCARSTLFRHKEQIIKKADRFICSCALSDIGLIHLKKIVAFP